MMEEEVTALILAEVVRNRTNIRIVAERFFSKRPELAYMRPFVRKVGMSIARNYMLLDHVLRELGYRSQSITRLMLARILIYEALLGKPVWRRIEKLAVKAGLKLEDVKRITSSSAEDYFKGIQGIDRLALKYSMPRWILEELLSMGVRDLDRMLSVLNRDPDYRWIRVAPGIDKDRLAEYLKSEGIEVEYDPILSDAAKVKRGLDRLSRTECYLKGCYVIQDRASILVGHVARPAGKILVDPTSGVGVKASHAVWLGARYVIASDIKLQRILDAKNFFKRLRADHIIDIVHADGRKLFLRGYEVIIVDPPCTDLGRLQVEPEIRMWLTRGDVKFYRRLQLRLLLEAAKRASKGTTIVYSVCTFTRSETVWVIRRLLEEVPYLEVVEAEPRIGLRPQGLPEAQLLLPHISESQGFFIAKLIKV
ncbi:MAG: RsmB/NOP family class I SAM-dependent RNA methyltransferase [Pyrodictiaceae archaeon]